MNKVSKRNLLFWSGVALGSGIAYFLNTKQGKELRQNVASTANDYSDKVQEGVKSTYASTTDTINEVLEKSKSTLNTLEQETKSTINKVSDNAKKAINNFQRATENIEENLN